MFFDMLAIPADAPHPKNAHLFINYLLRPDVAAKNSSTMHYATSNAAAYSLIDPAVYNDRGIYPSDAQKAHMYPECRAQPGLYARAQPHLDALQDRTDVNGGAVMSSYLQLENVSKRFGDFVAVDNVSLSVERGEIFCLLGASGCGKTTLLRMLAGFETPSCRPAADRRPGSGRRAALPSGRST